MKTNAVVTAIYHAMMPMNRVFIYRHTHPDPDAVGTQFGLAALLREIFPDKTVVAMAPVPAALATIGTTTTEKITPDSRDLVIAVDCANHQRLAGAIPADAFVIKIDHHPNHDPYGQLNWVDEHYSSCAEMVVEFYRLCAKHVPLTPAIAAPLYAGMIGDTVQFSTPETSAQTLATASCLAASGIDVARISHQVGDWSLAQGRLAGALLQRLTVTAEGLAYVTLSTAVLDQFSVDEAATEALVALPGQLKDVRTWLLFIAMPDGQYRVHLRSKGLRVDTVARQFGGGGHPLASGTFLADQAMVTQLITVMQTQLKATK